MKAFESENIATSHSHFSNPYFGKKGERGFFSRAIESDKPFFSPSFIQTKLTVGQPNDKYEREAETLSNEVVEKLENPNPKATVQMKCKECEDDGEKLQKKEGENGKTGLIQKHIYKSNDDSHIQSNSTESKLKAFAGKGKPLMKNVKSNMESAFGADFSSVKIHTDEAAIQMNENLGAKAFTHGSEIYFNKEEYAPESLNGKSLLAHELTHVIQQGKSNYRSPSSTPNIQLACGRSGIGHPTGCNFSESTVEEPKYLFQVNCNNFRAGNEVDLREDSKKIQPGDVVEIHGFASIEGDSNFNLDLSCARALKARKVVQQELNKLGITADIRVFYHGGTGTEANKDLQRSVVVTKNSPHQPPTPEPIEPDLNESVLIWLNAFIPETVPDGTETISKGVFAGKTCIPAPGPFGCALTDNRSFSDSKLAKTRMRLFILVNLKDLTFQFGGFSDVTHHVDKDNGEILCKEKASGTFRVDGQIMSTNPDGLGMKFIAFGNNPCVPLSPNIDFMGMLGIDRKDRRIKVQALLDEFPAFEMYISSTKTFRTKTIFQKPPACNDSRNVMCLFGGPTVPAEGDIHF